MKLVADNVQGVIILKSGIGSPRRHQRGFWRR